MIHEPMDADEIARAIRDQAETQTDFGDVANAFTALEEALIERFRAHGKYEAIGQLYCEVGDRVEAALRDELTKNILPAYRRVLERSEA
jgi:hypothetical protein